MKNFINMNDHIDNYFIDLRFLRARNEKRKCSDFTKISSTIKTSVLDCHFLACVKMIANGDLTRDQKAILHEQLAEQMSVSSSVIDDKILEMRKK